MFPPGGLFVDFKWMIQENSIFSSDFCWICISMMYGAIQFLLYTRFRPFIAHLQVYYEIVHLIWSSNTKTMSTSWDELISPRLRQLAWAGIKATEQLQTNKFIVLLDWLEVIFIYLFSIYCFGSTLSKIWPAIAEIFHFLYILR